MSQQRPGSIRRQLHLALDDAQLRGMTPAQRQTVLSTLACLMLEANGILIEEAGHERD
jgi:hypothetical protein